jgi:REP-associated tyrosine transposase
MARANRHFISGYAWRITHRCHKKEFLLKLVKDRERLLYCFFQAKKRYGLCILNFIITSNHFHLLVYDKGHNPDHIPKSIQLIAGRTGQEYNQRKNRKGAFWEDRYHATAVQDDSHLIQCINYIDMNMVRAGVVDHPEEWKQSGYNEIRNPRKRYGLINYDCWMKLLSFSEYDSLKAAHNQWVENTFVHEFTDLRSIEKVIDLALYVNVNLFLRTNFAMFHLSPFSLNIFEIW